MLNVLAGTMAHSLMCKLKIKKIKKSRRSAFPKRPLNPSASASSFHIIVLELSQHKQEEDNEDNEEDTEEDEGEDEQEDDDARSEPQTCSIIHHPCSSGTFRLLESVSPACV